jgi:hypothetical protein
MAWIYLAESEELPWPWNPGSDQLPTVKTTGTPNVFCSQECATNDCQWLRSGMMYEHSQKTICPFPLTSFTGGSHARTSVLPAAESAWEEAEAGYFLKLSDWLASFDQPSFSWKTRQLSLFEGLTEFSWSSLRWGTTVAGRLYQPAKLELHTLESDGSCLPTPTASEYGSSNNGTRDGVTPFAIPKKPSLSTLARKFIPTPRASDGEKGGPNQVQGGVPSLSAMAARFMPTPAARDWKDGLTPKRHSRNSPTVAVAVAEAGHPGYLNPHFVEAMQGFPIGWTNCEEWATRALLPSTARRSRAYLESGAE